MDRIAKALHEHDEVFAEINDVLFGGGADELISKLSAEEKKFQRRQAQIGLGTNAVGLAAGVAGTSSAYKDFQRVKAVPKGTVHIPAPIKISNKTKVLAAAGLGLQGVNVAGDLIANRVLNRAAKKPKKKRIRKSNPDQADLHVNGSLKLRAVQSGAKKAKPVLQVQGKKLQEGLKKAKDAVTKLDESEIVWEGEFSKIDTDKRQVFGYCSVTKIDGEDVVDKQGDHIDIEEVEKAAYDYVTKSRKGGDMHKRDGAEPHQVSDMIESVVFTPEKIEKMGLPEDMNLGWWVGFQVNDEDTWQEVKKGKRQGFSIHGKGARVEKTLS